MSLGTEIALKLWVLVLEHVPLHWPTNTSHQDSVVAKAKPNSIESFSFNVELCVECSCQGSSKHSTMQLQRSLTMSLAGLTANQDIKYRVNMIQPICQFATGRIIFAPQQRSNLVRYLFHKQQATLISTCVSLSVGICMSYPGKQPPNTEIVIWKCAHMRAYK